MTSETVHMTEILGDPPVTHQNHDLMQRLRRQAPEIPHRRVTPQVRLRIPLLRVNKIGKGSRIKKTGVLFPTRSQFPSSV